VRTGRNEDWTEKKTDEKEAKDRADGGQEKGSPSKPACIRQKNTTSPKSNPAKRAARHQVSRCTAKFSKGMGKNPVAHGTPNKS